MIKLDKKDRKLLYELDCNSRQSVQQLSKKIGLSKDAVKYRLNKLIKNNIIKSFNAVVDTGKLGYASYRLFVKLCNLSPEKEREIVEYLLANNNLIWLVQVEGKWDINTWFLYKKLDEMNMFFVNYNRKYNSYIDKTEFGVYTKITYYSRGYLLGKKQEFEMPIGTLPDEKKLDENELKIIGILSKNARAPIVEISKAAGLTPKTVINKIRRLEKDEIIIGYRTEFDLGRLGYRYYKMHINTHNTTEQKLKRFGQYIRIHPNIIYRDYVLGGYDIEIEIQVKSDTELRRLVEDIRTNFSDIIKDYEILHYYTEHRLRFYPFF